MKKFNKAVGVFGEDIACQFLEKNGYKIIERNFKNFSNKEIDIIAKDKNIICFIEVKARKNTFFGDAIEAIDRKKRLAYKSAAESYLAENKIILPVRFDVVTVMLGGDNSPVDIKLFKNAFEGES